MERELFLRDFVKNARIEEFPALASPEISEIAQSFRTNLETSLSVLGLPPILILTGIIKTEQLALSAEALSEGGAFKTYTESDDTRRSVDERVQELWEKERSKKDTQQRLQAELEAMVDRLIGNPGLSVNLVSLTYLATSGLWTCIECLATDLWVVALNCHPIALAQGVLSSLPRDEVEVNVSRRGVSVGMLARYGFDMRSHMGTVLSRKFDFTGVTGIKEAYSAAFPHDVQLEELLSDQALHRLEAARHVIVHRGGIVDGEYVRRIAEEQQIGDRLSIAVADFEEYIRAVRDVGVGLLQYVDGWLIRQRPPDTPP